MAGRTGRPNKDIQRLVTLTSRATEHGGRGRCYPYWQEVIKCYQSVGEPSECRLQADDYLECLHHRKEIARAKLIQSEFIKHAAHLDREAQKGADIAQGGAVATVGLIDKSSSGGK